MRFIITTAKVDKYKVILRVTFGPYNTTCKPNQVLAVKHQLKRLVAVCPVCGK